MKMVPMVLRFGIELLNNEIEELVEEEMEYESGSLAIITKN